ncbi:MAG: MFS transporter [Spirochaetales bacterium]
MEAKSTKNAQKNKKVLKIEYLDAKNLRILTWVIIRDIQTVMSLSPTFFFFFSIFATVNIYLPLFFKNMGYSSTEIGLLLAIFEISGTIITFFLCRMPAKSGKYGLYLLFFGILLILLPFPLLLLPPIGTVLCIILYAIPIKVMVPISDSYVNLKLGCEKYKYGMIRSFGSMGFVVMSILMQYIVNIDTISQVQSALWLSVPAFLMCVSLIVIPHLLTPVAEETQTMPPIATAIESAKTSDKSLFGRFSPLFWLIIAVLVLGNFAQYANTKFFSLYVKEYLQSDSFAILWAVAVACEVPFMFFSYRFIRYFGSKKLIIFCVFIIAVRNFVYVLFPTVLGATFGQLFHGITYGLLHPAAVIFIAEEIKDNKDAVLGQAIYSVGASGIASVVGSLFGGIIIDNFGYPFFYMMFGFFPLAGLALYAMLNKRLRTS